MALLGDHVVVGPVLREQEFLVYQCEALRCRRKADGVGRSIPVRDHHSRQVEDVVRDPEHAEVVDAPRPRELEHHLVSPVDIEVRELVKLAPGSRHRHSGAPFLDLLHRD
jgi:hypothetical protein